MSKFVSGVVVGLFALPVLGAIYAASGLASAAVADPPFPFEKVLAGIALHAKIRREAPTRALSSFTPDDLMAGAMVYRRNDCSDCHGMPLPNDGKKHVFFPPAPQLLVSDGMVTDDPIGETFWKVKNGIRLTGMPSFKDTLTDEQIWQVSALLATADKLSPDVLDALKRRPGPPPGTGGAPGAGAAPGAPASPAAGNPNQQRKP
jgi:thiosulfate dehydrogenase